MAADGSEPMAANGDRWWVIDASVELSLMLGLMFCKGSSNFKLRAVSYVS